MAPTGERLRGREERPGGQERADGIHISLAKNVMAQSAADEVGRSLVLAGLAIRGFVPVQASFEQRFPEITSRLEEAA
jgi:hypothetical protein